MTWLGMNDRFDNLFRAIVQDYAAMERRQKAKDMANTGAKGFAATLKAHADAMRAEFSKLHDELTSEFTVMQSHLESGRVQVAQLKADNAELKEAFGIENDVKP